MNSVKPESKKAKILVVDDELIVSANIKYTLQKYGYEFVKTAGTANEAIKIAEENRYDLVLMDVNLKDDMDGIQTAQIIQGFSDTAIVFLTAYSDIDTIDRAKGIGPYGYLIKPFESSEMYSTVEMALYKHSLEKRLKENEERFRMLFDKAPLGYQSLDENGYFIDVNSAWLDVLGYEYKEVIGKWFGDFLAPEYKEAFRERFPLFKEAGKIHSEFEMVHKDGSYHYIAFEGRVGYTPNGDFKQTHCILADITEQKKAEIALKKSEKKFRNIFENVQDVYYETSINGIILEVSPSVTVLSKGQYHREELVGRSINEFYINPEERQSMLSVLLEKGSVSDFELTFKNRDGSEFICSISSRICLNREGEPEKIIGSMRDITERKRAGELIKKSEIEFRAVWENSASGMRITDENGIVIKVNNAFCEMFGKSKEELEGKPLSCIYPKDVGEHVIFKHIERFRAKTIESKIEKNLKLWNGKSIWVQVVNSFIEIEGAQPFLLGIFTDISERKWAEMVLRESEENYREIINGMNDTAWVIGFDGKFIDINRRAIEMLGYSREELLSMGPADIDSSLAKEQIRDLIERIPQEQEQIFETEHISKNGERFPVEICSTLVNYNGKRAILSIARDLTERKRAENVIRESELRFQQVSENAKEWIWEVDENGVYTYSSPIVKELLGYEVEELIGKKHFYDFFEQTNKEYLKQLAVEIFERRERFNELINTNRHKDGREVILSTSGVPILNNEGKLIGYRGVDVDITERKRAEKSLSDIIEKNPMSIQIVDVNGFTISGNPSFLKLFGSIPPSDFSIFEDLKRRSPELEKLILSAQRGEVVHLPDVCDNIHDIIPEAPDLPLWIRALIFPLTDSKGRPEKFVIMHENITESKIAENALRESELKYRELFTEDLTGNYIVSVDGTVILCNNSMAKMLGLDSIDELLKLNVSNLYKIPGEREKFLDLVRANKKLEEYEHDLIRPDGKVLSVIENVIGEFNEQGELIRLKGYLFDITERKRAEKELLEQMDEISRFNKLMVGREEKMIELKNEINTLLEKEGKPKKYNTGF